VIAFFARPLRKLLKVPLALLLLEPLACGDDGQLSFAALELQRSIPPEMEGRLKSPSSA
jgi:hypothetical protein